MAGRGHGRGLLLLAILLIIVPLALSELNNIIIVSRMADEVALKCRIRILGETIFFKDFYLKPGVLDEQIFTPTKRPFFIECYYGYKGNYASKVRIFDVVWPDASDCRVDRGGCLYEIKDAVLYKTTRARGKRVVGDLPIEQCKRFLGIATECWQRRHRYRLLGEKIDYWEFFWAQ
uniref:DUF7771 domain-containing protein n=1 Tax=Ananas comosus var. bracteatus TaxID=296719 RepID=A0A6V7NPV3_ANACO|nr:unnamed protein product [Ananas comosus var. bracteatus]